MRRLYEWKVMTNSQNASNTNISSSGQAAVNTYKNRFTKLIDYAKAHKSSTAVRTEAKKITSNSFHYMEHHNANGSEWDIDISVAISRFNGTWALNYYIDGVLDSDEDGTGYEDLIRALSFYMNTPNHGTPEYNDLLVESMSTIEDFKTYESLWENLNDCCWFGKYIDVEKNKKFVFISKELTADTDEADELMQELIPEPYTKFIFGGSVSRASAEREGWTELK